MLFELYSDGESEIVKVLIPQPCPTLCNPMGCSPPGSSVHWILQAGILEWVAMLPSRGSSWLRDWTQVSWGSCIAGEFFTPEPLGKRDLLFTRIEENGMLYNFCFLNFNLDNCFTICNGFCHTSTWISHRCTYIHFLLSLPPTSLPTPSL